MQKAVLFDLDGTLLDTAGDLGFALNSTLQAQNRPSLPLAQIRPFAAQGSKGLLRLGFHIEEDHPTYAGLNALFLEYYFQHLLDSTQLFPGMAAVLGHIESAGIPWGIVTNKPEQFTLKLLEGLQLTQRAACIISGDTLKHRKPHPEPILEACRLLGQKPSDCLYVGDAEIDVIASKAAGTASLVALYGYIHAHEDPKTWLADGYIEHPGQMIEWL